MQQPIGFFFVSFLRKHDKLLKASAYRARVFCYNDRGNICMRKPLFALFLILVFSTVPRSVFADEGFNPLVSVKLLQGFKGVVYEAKEDPRAVAPASPIGDCSYDFGRVAKSETRAPFDDGTKAYWLDPGAVEPPEACDYVGFNPGTDGLTFVFAMARRDDNPVLSAGANRVGGVTAETLYDNVPQSDLEDRLIIEIWERCEGCDTSSASPLFTFYINPDQHVYGTGTDGNGKPSAVDPKAYSVDSDNSRPWAGSLTVKWDLLKLSAKGKTFDIRYAHLEPVAPTPPCMAEFSGVGDCRIRSVTFQATPAFDDDMQPKDGLSATASHRYAALDKTGQHQTGSQGNPSATPAPTPTPWPALSTDVNFPGSPQTLFGATFAQDFASNLGTVQQKIKKLASRVGLQTTEAKKLACRTCQPFQVLYGDFFGIQNSSDVLSLLSGNNRFGEDSQPILFSDIGDLGVGSLASYANSDTSFSLTQLHAKNALDDNAASFSTKLKGLNIRALAVNINHPPTGVPPHISTDALSVSWDHSTDSGVIESQFVSSDVAPIVRASYDITDNAVDGFTGVQFTRKTSTFVPTENHAWEGSTIAIAPGYKFGGVRYSQLDTDPIPFAGTSGPTIDLNLAKTYPGRITPSIKLESYWLRNSLADVAQSTDLTTKLLLGPSRNEWTYGVSFEWTDARVSRPFIALQQIATLPSADRYPSIRGHIEPTPAPGTQPSQSPIDDLEDHTLSFSVETPKYFDVWWNGSVGIDLDHKSTTCQLDTATAADILCRENPSTRLFTGNVVAHWDDWFELGGFYQPPQTAEGSPIASDERVYNAFLEAKVGRCPCTFTVAASNDTGRIGFDPNKLGEALTAQFAVENIFQRATLAFGYVNSSSPSLGVTSVPIGSGPLLDHRVRTFVTLRVGTAAFETTKTY